MSQKLSLKSNISKRILALGAISFLLGAVFAFVSLSSSPSSSAATLDGFKPGNIISDATMSNYNSMSVSEIQNFLTSKNSCKNADYNFYLSLKQKYPHLSWHWSGEPYNGHFVCLSEERFGSGTTIGEGQTAAEIIYEAAQTHRINPQVLLVLLEKEQSLITDDYPNNVQYRSATGYGCPDTAACDSKYYGLKNQINKAAELFRYTLDNGYYAYPEQTKGVYVAYHPNKSCGSSEVYIENRATAALYRYTPYQPNTAAINAGTGTGDACSAYGNRNFYIFFTKWFGDPTATTPSALAAPKIENVYKTISNASVVLGEKVGDIQTNPSTGIIFQEYQNGYIVGTNELGFYESRGKIREYWENSGFEYGKLGFPVGNIGTTASTGMIFQQYQNGYIVGNEELGYYESNGKIREVWKKAGFEGGVFGFPVSDIKSNPSTGIIFQEYQNGYIVGTNELGFYESRGKIREYWENSGFEYGKLGFPVGNIKQANDGSYYQDYQHGRVYTDNTNAWLGAK